jgi:hypothetical protein
MRQRNKPRGLSLRANYTDRETDAYRRSYCHLLQVDGAPWSVADSYRHILGFLDWKNVPHAIKYYTVRKEGNTRSLTFEE